MVLSIDKSKRINPPYFCFSLILLLYLLLSLFAFEAVNIFQDGTEIFMNDVEFYLINTAAIAFAAFLIIFAKKLFKIRFNAICFFFLLILFISNSYAVFSLPSLVHTAGDITYPITAGFKLRSFYSFINVALSLYILYAITPQCKLTESGMSHSFSFISLVALSAIIASYFLDAPIYQEMLGSTEFHMWGGPKSYCTEKNTFGALILFGICCEIYLFFFDKKWWRLPILAYYFVSVFLTLSKTSIVCAIFLFLIAISYGFIRLFMKNKKWWVLILFALYLAFNALLCYLFFHNEIFASSFVGKVFIIIKNSLLEPEDTSMGSRMVIWEKLIALVSSDKRFLLFGLGDASFPFIFSFASDGAWNLTFYAHNGFLDQLGRGGLIRLAVYLLLLIYIFVLCFRFISSKKSKGGALYLVFLLTFLLHSSVESEYLLGNDFKSIIWSFLTLLPLLALNEDKKHPERSKELIKGYCSSPSEYPSTPFFAAFSTVLLSLSLSLSPVFLFLGLSSYLSFSFGALLSMAMLLLGIIFLIIRIRYFADDKEKVAFIVASILFVFLSFASSYIINAYFASSPIPYTHACYAVSLFFTLISVYGSIIVLSKGFAPIKAINLMERAYRRKKTQYLLFSD